MTVFPNRYELKRAQRSTSRVDRCETRKSPGSSEERARAFCQYFLQRNAQSYLVEFTE